MGVIQNSLNTMIATVAGSILGAKHIEQQAAQVKTSELSELASLSKEIPEIKNVDVPEAQATRDFDAKAAQLIEEDMMKEVAQGRLPVKKLQNLTAQRKALEISQGKLDEKNLQKTLKEQRFAELKKKYANEYENATNPKTRG